MSYETGKIMKKDIIKSLIAIKQSEIPFDVIERDVKLPINRKKIITVPGVRRCGKSTLMEIAINNLIRDGVPSKNILWLGFDDELLTHALFTIQSELQRYLRIQTYSLYFNKCPVIIMESSQYVNLCHNPHKKGDRAYVNIIKHTSTYRTKFYFNINYFINALLQNRLHSKLRYHIFAT